MDSIPSFRKERNMRMVAALMMAALIGSFFGCGKDEAAPARFHNVADNLTTADKEGQPSVAESDTSWAKSSGTRDKKKAASPMPMGETPAKSTPSIVSGLTPEGTISKDAPGKGSDKAPVLPAAIADPVVGTATPAKKKKQETLPSGVLTAGSFDDNLDPRVFLSFLKRFSHLP